MKVPYFGRLLTAMVTPMHEDGGINYAAMAEFAEWLINNGSDGLVVCGTTGESPTISKEEKLELFRTVVERINKRVPVIAGTGCNNTMETVELTKEAAKLGVDGFLVVGPYYNKPPQEGYYQHFKAVAEATDLPVIVYNVPTRTSSNISPQTVLRLAKDFKNIVAIKEAAGCVSQAAELYSLLPEDFTIYSGDDLLILPFMSVGASGLISVVSNTGGQLLQELMQAFAEGRVKDAMDINARMIPLAKALFVTTNPIPVKEAVTMLTPINAGPLRLPLVSLSEAENEKMCAVFKKYNLI